MIRVSKTCPECGTNKVKILTPMMETQPAYLCANGHFFLEPLPSDLASVPLRVN
jgi:hypothetical protein